ncbi:MAG: biopolymer transporter ExbD [Gemmatimonadota bacterium]
MHPSAPPAPPEIHREINVTPLIDVLLVLFITYIVIIFSRLVADVQLPAPDLETTPGPTPHQIVLELTADGEYAVNGQRVPLSELPDFLTTIFRHRPLKLLFVSSDPSRRYAEVIEAVDLAKGAGVDEFAFMPGGGAR